LQVPKLFDHRDLSGYSLLNHLTDTFYAVLTILLAYPYNGVYKEFLHRLVVFFVQLEILKVGLNLLTIL